MTISPGYGTELSVPIIRRLDWDTTLAESSGDLIKQMKLQQENKV
jgi:hypothetical protein